MPSIAVDNAACPSMPKTFVMVGVAQANCELQCVPRRRRRQRLVARSADGVRVPALAAAMNRVAAFIDPGTASGQR